MFDPQPGLVSELKRARAGVSVGWLALLATILIQSATMLIWGGKIDARVAELEKRQAASSVAGETIARLDERTAALMTTMDRIDRRLTDQEARR